MPFVAYIARRVTFGLVVLFVVSILTFVIFVKLPSSDPARLMTQAPQTSEQYQAARESLGLDEPLLVQYARFAKGFVPVPGLFLSEDVYFSYRTHVPVREALVKRAPYTVAVGIGTLLLVLLVSIPLGILGALRPASVFDRAGTSFVLLGISTPSFWLGILGLYVFWFRLHIAPSAGIPPDENVFEAILSGRFVLPWIVGAIGLGAVYVRLMRADFLEVLDASYMRTAAAKGAGRARVVLRHGLRASLGSVVTIFSFDLANVVLGSVVIESVFNIPGIGLYSVEALHGGDLPALMGVTILFAVAIVTLNLVADVVYTALDPRVKLGARSLA